jgi:hypothetical protein
LFVNGILHFLLGLLVEFGLSFKGDLVAVEDNGGFLGRHHLFVYSDVFGGDVPLFRREGT